MVLKITKTSRAQAMRVIASEHGCTVNNGRFVAKSYWEGTEVASAEAYCERVLKHKYGYDMPSKGQAKHHSLAETLTSTFVGYIVSILSQLAIFPLFNIHVQLHQNLEIGLYFTAISIARGYIFRRIFNALT